jgi:hypothetical protein
MILNGSATATYQHAAAPARRGHGRGPPPMRRRGWERRCLGAAAAAAAVARRRPQVRPRRTGRCCRKERSSPCCRLDTCQHRLEKGG